MHITRPPPSVLRRHCRLTTTTTAGTPPPPPPAGRRIPRYHPSLLPLQSPLSFKQLLQAQAHLTVTGLLRHPFAASRLLKSLLSSSSSSATFHHSLLLFRHLPSSPDVVTLNTLLQSLPPAKALPFFFSHFHLPPNSYTFPPLFSAAAQSANLSHGEIAHCQTVKRGFDTVLPVRNSMINMYVSCGLLGCGHQLFDEMTDRDLVSWNTMVGGYVKAGDLDCARELFERMPDRNVVSWNIMIGGYLNSGILGMVLKMFREMGERGVRGSVTTMVNVVMACGRCGAVREGRSVHGYWVKGFEGRNLILETALVDMYGKCGKVEIARRVFDGMERRNLVCWNAMVLGYCIHGPAKDGLALFNEMVERGEEDFEGVNGESLQKEPERVSPDEITFVGVLCACVRGGLLAEGKKYFEQMTSVYNLRPTFAHYWCMANLYGCLGLIQEAEEVLKLMPEESESLVWGGLLGACRFKGDVELGERIAMRLIELEPFNSSRYALLLNFYMAAERWEDAHKVKEMMKERRVRIMRTGRLVDLNEIVHNFKVGDQSHPEMEKIYMMMDDIAAKLKLKSCIPDAIEGV